LEVIHFQRMNVSPLGPPWATVLSNPGLQIVGDVCETLPPYAGVQTYNPPCGTPNDQYASVTIAAIPTGFLNLVVRGNAYGSGYQLQLQAGQNYWSLLLGGESQIAIGSATPEVGDVWAVAAIGTTLYVIRNGAVLATVIDTTYASGQTALSLAGGVQVSNFSMGRAWAGKTITGTWNYPNGQPAAGAILTLQLSQDGEGPSSQLLHVPVKITLDNTGSIPAGMGVFANDQIQPAGTYYIVSVKDPVFGQVYFERLSISGTSPINLNALVPASKPNAG
jgi:hypothetical protein